MASTFVNDLRLTELGTGDASGTWGNTTNVSLELIGEALGFGTEAITTNADTHASTVADGATDQARAMFIKYTGTLDSACTITIGPNTISRMHFIENATSGSQSIIISQGSGANVTILTGQTKAVYLDGAGSGAAVTDAFVDMNFGGTTTIGDNLTLNSDSAVVSFGADADTTLTHTDGSGLTLNGTNKLMFNDASQFIQGASATVLDIAATDTIELTATNIAVVGTMGATGVVTANAGVVVDEMTLDGDTLTASDDFIIDAVGDITFDAFGGDFKYLKNGTQLFTITDNSSDIEIKTNVSDKDMRFKGNDGGAAITALTLDMSDGGTAIFNKNADFPDGSGTRYGTDADLQIYHDGSNSFINDTGTGNLFLDSVAGSVIIRVNTDENAIEAIGDGAVNISHNGSTKIATASTGVNVTGGIGLGGTGTANILDDYEEGTFTPTVSGFSFSSSRGNYVKIGNVVHFGITLVLPSTSATGHLKITNPPFTVKNPTDFGGALNFTNNNVDNVTVITTTGNDIQFYKTGASFATFADFSGSTVVASGSYLHE